MWQSLAHLNNFLEHGLNYHLYFYYYTELFNFLNLIGQKVFLIHFTPMLCLYLVIIVSVPSDLSGWSRCWAKNVSRVSGFLLYFPFTLSK